MEIKSTYNLYLDDIRIPRDSFNYTKDTRFNLLDWVIVRSAEEFIKTVNDKFKDGEWPDLIAWDNDLSDEHYNPDIKQEDYKEKTGFFCAQWLVSFCLDNKMNMPEYIVHSQNPAGKANIIGLLDGFKKFQSK